MSKLDNQGIPFRLLGRDIVFFDGQCVLCHRMMGQLLKIDKQQHFLLCAQQTEMGQLILGRHGINVDDLSTVYLVTDCANENEKVLTQSDAFIYVLSKTKEYKGLASLIRKIFPRPLLNFGYKIIASNRYRLFGKKNEFCSIVSPEDRGRIIA